MITLEEIIEKQKQLDTYLKKEKNSRDRDFLDILGSILAKTIKFEEECDYIISHKTWEKRKYDPEKQLTKCTDIFFFIVQFLILKRDFDYFDFLEERLKTKIYKKFETSFEKNEERMKAIVNFQRVVCNERRKCLEKDTSPTLGKILYFYEEILLAFGYTFEDITNEYLKKWEYNMQRYNFKGDKNESNS